MSNTLYYRELTEETNDFLNEMYDMIAFNLDVFEFEVKPKTTKSFYLTVGYKGKTETILFKASDTKGVNGVFKTAKVISILKQKDK